tara:strand:+ start:1922 stop:2983 length:1062 start_codon:yes stop_codon:yes gene_type:complete
MTQENREASIEVGQRNTQAGSTMIVDIDDTLLSNGIEPIQSVIDYVNGDFDEYKIVVITGRPEAARDETVSALAEAGIKYDSLIMKPDDSVPTSDYKKAEAEKLLAEGEVDKAIDNDQANIDAYKSLGIEAVLPSELNENDDTMEMNSIKRYSNVMTDTVHWVATEIDDKRSIAYSNLEVRSENEGRTIVGYAAIWDSPSEYMGFTEFVKRGAFSKTLNDGADVRLLIDHEGVPLARSKSGTLILVEDDRGLRVEAELDPMNPDAARVMSAMKRGDLSQMSFAFRTVKDSWNADRSVRELREVQLFDVSVVTFPAYEQTVAELRKANEPVIVAPVSTLSLRKNQIALQKLRSR